MTKQWTPSVATIAVVIPSGSSERNESLQRLIEDIRAQSVGPVELEIVKGVSPNGKARNLGVARTNGEILVFLDDDVRLGANDLIEKLAQALQEPGVGLVGTAQLLPPDSSNFQRQCAEQISRSQSPIVEVLTDSDMVTTQCCAIRREVLNEVGGFHNQILRGVDPELRHRVREAGYRIAVVAGIWHFHPMPKNLSALCRMAWRNGHASAFAQRRFPETVIFNPEGHVAEFDSHPPLHRRLGRRISELVGRVFGGAFYGVFYDLCYALGYFRQILEPLPPASQKT